MIQAIKDGVYQWLSSELTVAAWGGTVIFADQAAPRPAEPYATIRINAGVPVGNDELREVQEVGPDVIGSYRGQRTATVSLNIFGTNAVQLMRTARMSLAKQSVLDTLYNDHDLSVIDAGEILNMTDLLETRFQKRAQMDVIIGFAESIDDNLGAIEKVELNEKTIEVTP